MELILTKFWNIRVNSLLSLMGNWVCSINLLRSLFITTEGHVVGLVSVISLVASRSHGPHFSALHMRPIIIPMVYSHYTWQNTVLTKIRACKYFCCLVTNQCKFSILKQIPICVGWPWTTCLDSAQGCARLKSSCQPPASSLKPRGGKDPLSTAKCLQVVGRISLLVDIALRPSISCWLLARDCSRLLKATSRSLLCGLLHHQFTKRLFLLEISFRKDLILFKGWPGGAHPEQSSFWWIPR